MVDSPLVSYVFYVALVLDCILDVWRISLYYIFWKMHISFESDLKATLNDTILYYRRIHIKCFKMIENEFSYLILSSS